VTIDEKRMPVTGGNPTMPSTSSVEFKQPQYRIRDDFLQLTPDSALRKNAEGDVLLECDWHDYQPWQYLPDDVVRAAGHPTWPAGTAAKVFVAECMYQKYGYDRSKWDPLALKFLRRS
jgi:hypothetical protein